MLKILKRLPQYKILGLLGRLPKYSFSGDHHDDHGHHQIDRQSIKLRDNKSGYYLNPNQVARRMMRVIAQHERVENPQKITLNTQWHQMGLNQLDTVEILVGIQNEFSIQFPDQVAEKFKDVHDVMQYVSRSFWSQ